jgi:UV DNA damage repair endonuclease
LSACHLECGTSVAAFPAIHVPHPKQFALLGSPGHAYTQETLQTLSPHAFTS